MLLLAFGLFGLIVGSFLNVLVLRYGKQGLGGRSACVSCKRLITWYDNIPVVSWLVLRGRCRACSARISIQYPLVEISCGALFASIGGALMPLLFSGSAASFLLVVGYLAIGALLIAIATYDIRYMLIPDPWVYAVCALSLLSIFLSPQPPGNGISIALAAGVLAALPLFLLWLVSRGAWMGFGDVKLALGIGWLLGPVYGFAAVMLSFIIGAVVSVGILLPLPYLVRLFGITSLEAREARFTMKSEVPFGPFLIASCIALWLMALYGVPLPLLA